MAVSLTHAFVSAVPDEANPGEVGPDEWNAEHTLTCGDGKVLGRDIGAGAGAVTEVDIASLMGSGSITIYDPSSGNDTVTASEAAGTATIHLFKAGGTNTGVATFNGDPIKDQAGNDLAAGMIKAGLYYWMLFDGTNYYLITSGSVV